MPTLSLSPNGCNLHELQGKKKDGNGSRSGTPTKEVASKKTKAAGKRKKESTPTKEGATPATPGTTTTDAPAAKKAKIELNLGGNLNATPTASSNPQNTPLSQIDGINEEAVRR